MLGVGCNNGDWDHRAPEEEPPGAAMQFISGARALVMDSIPLLQHQQEDDQYSTSIMDPDESERTERKRKRERDRRSELSRAFEDLGTVLNDLDPVPVVRGGSGNGKKGKNKADDNLTRLDKLHRTTALLRRMHRDMVAMQHQIKTYEQQPARHRQHLSDRDDGEKEVIVMVPTLTLQQDSTVQLGHPGTSSPLPLTSIAASRQRHQQQQQADESTMHVNHHQQPGQYDLFAPYSTTTYQHTQGTVTMSSGIAGGSDHHSLYAAPPEATPAHSHYSSQEQQQQQQHHSYSSPTNYHRPTYNQQHSWQQQPQPPPPPLLSHPQPSPRGVSSYPAYSSPAASFSSPGGARVVAGGYLEQQPPSPRGQQYHLHQQQQQQHQHGRPASEPQLHHHQHLRTPSPPAGSEE